ncbi:prohead protease/major capsid protein fusion protein [Pannonibacter tanglangensis]|uniref:Peptidase U35 n=1 Tax=Pannonibacter tanglangensis TaxID=2750084 RepID=A0ABW9ZM69_9HYPH|nr:prohead protease/major capsid protein fusion protein [Pannonibacter sp. XCT-34]NBN63825.1 peptidase U35 [Pannonibacter sp. XCT-34]
MKNIRSSFSGSRTLDVAARTVEVVLATETPVRRRDALGQYDEVLRCSPDALVPDRLDVLPVLDSHRSGEMADRLGQVVPGSVRFEPGRIVATVRLARSEKADALLQELQDGATLGVSVGYQILTAVETGKAPARTITASLWQALEASFVAIPADPAARTRSAETGEIRMSHESSTSDRRAVEILAAARIAKIDATDEIVTRALADGTSVTDFRSQLLDVLASRQPHIHTQIETRGMQDGNRTRAEAMTDALLTRMNPAHRPAPDAREFVGLSAAELARQCLHARGEQTHGMAPGALVTRALHTTSDFPLVLANAATKQLQTAYASVPAALRRIARESTARNFRPKMSVRLDGPPKLVPVNEHGEYKRGTWFEAAESYSVATFGRVFAISRAALINDDLGAFAEAAARMGQVVSTLEAELLSSLLSSNPVMSDGNALFSTPHRNVAAATALSVPAIGAARTLMRRQVDQASHLVNVSPRYLVVPVELEMAGEQAIAEIAAARPDDANPFAGRLELVVEPRLVDPKAWYLAADPAAIVGLEYAYLEGQPGPYIETRSGFDVDGVEIKVRHDFGAGWLDWRGIVRNPGE